VAAGPSEQHWSGNVSKLAPAPARLQSLRPALEGILESEGVPKEFVAFVVVESGAIRRLVTKANARALVVHTGNSASVRSGGRIRSR
jgi:hypothetical protein